VVYPCAFCSEAGKRKRKEKKGKKLPKNEHFLEGEKEKTQKKRGFARPRAERIEKEKGKEKR